MTDVVKRPGAASDPDGADLLSPVATFLRGLALLPTQDGLRQGEGSKLAIEDFSLEITKSTQKLIKWGSTGGAGAAAVAAVAGGWRDAPDVVVAVLVLTAGIVIGSGVLALARVMDGDVRGRASTATAAVEARGVVAKALLESFSSTSKDLNAASPVTNGPASKPEKPTETQLLLGLARYGERLKVQTSAGEDGVTGMRWTKDEGLELQLTSGDYVQATKVSSFAATG